MKTTRKTNGGPAMRAEYDFRQGVRGKYARRYAQGTNVVVLDPDVAKVFPDAESYPMHCTPVLPFVIESAKFL